MEIKRYDIYDEKEILALYKSVGWENYVSNPQMLEKAFRNSLLTLASYEDDRLVGIVRTVGDGASVVFVQDLLVHPKYQRRGIGTALLTEILRTYDAVYQIQLLTDHSDESIAFYRSLGFVPVEDTGCCAFIRLRTGM